MSVTVPAGPLESDPGGFVPRGGTAPRSLGGVLDGVELGAWDLRVAGWLAGLDTSTMLTIASWIARARDGWAAAVNGIRADRGTSAC